jgi:hypothetical protein
MPPSAADVELLLPPNPAQVRNAKNAGAAWIVDMPPLLFLRLTEARQFFESTDGILQKAKPLAFYLAPELQREMTVHPLLDIDLKTGRVRAHEGRHRAAAVANAGGAWYRVAIYPKPHDRLVRPKAFPRTWTNQFGTGFRVNIDKAIADGCLRILDDHVQDEYWRPDDEDE